MHEEPSPQTGLLLYQASINTKICHSQKQLHTETRSLLLFSQHRLFYRKCNCYGELQLVMTPNRCKRAENSAGRKATPTPSPATRRAFSRGVFVSGMKHKLHRRGNQILSAYFTVWTSSRFLKAVFSYQSSRERWLSQPPLLRGRWNQDVASLLSNWDSLSYIHGKHDVLGKI